MQNAETDKSGRTAQMEAIVAEHETSLLRYATRILNNPASAQDAVQNVFIKLFTNWQDVARSSRKFDWRMSNKGDIYSRKKMEEEDEQSIYNGNGSTCGFYFYCR